MPIGTSLGQTYSDEFDYASTPFKRPVGATEKPAGEFNSSSGSGVAGSIPIDREHHVPLVASAIMHPETGQMVGLAIDHRVPANPEYEPFLALHEGTELPWMQDYIKDGMSAQDAYHKAHDFATARESAAVRAYAVTQGKDPDKFQDEYKQFYRDAASVASQDTDKDRHPQAHTTQYGLDEAELGKTYTGTVPVQSAGIFRSDYKTWPERMADTAADVLMYPYDIMHGNIAPEDVIPRTTDMAMALVGFPGPKPTGALGSFAGISAKTADLDVLKTAKNMYDKGFGNEAVFAHTGWYRGAEGKWKFELNSSESKLKENLPQTGTLKDYLHFPDLYEAYPEIANLKVKQADGPWAGMYNPDTPSISLNTIRVKDPTELKNVLIHEIQHRIQHIEDFDKGSNPSKAISEVENFLLEHFDDPRARKMWEAFIKTPKTKAPYMNRPGEQEARLAEIRSNWTKFRQSQESPAGTLNRLRRDEPGFFGTELRYPNEPR